MMAAMNGGATTVQAVLDVGGSDLEAKEEEEDGCTAFLYACLKGDAESVRILAKAGCDTTVRSADGQTGLTLAAVHDKGGATTVQAVLDVGGSDLEAKDEETGCTAFLYACLYGDAESVRLLAEAGCDTTVRTADGQTGLTLAAVHGKGSATPVQARRRSPSPGSRDQLFLRPSAEQELIRQEVMQIRRQSVSPRSPGGGDHAWHDVEEMEEEEEEEEEEEQEQQQQQ
eukprot:COSAG02_NODE_15790_length_1141_cov_0.851248_1_plen_227_part_01